MLRLEPSGAEQFGRWVLGLNAALLAAGGGGGGSIGGGGGAAEQLGSLPWSADVLFG